MAYSDDNVNAKLSALNETQESIVTTAQWLMFHRRFAERTTKIWYDKLGTSNPSKRLNLIYLINEVAQQSKFRKREEFRSALAAIIADGVSVAYNGSTSDIKGKIKRVIDVWKDRETFEENVRDDIERRIDAIDRKRGEMKRPLMGGSGGGSGGSAAIPADLQELAKLHARVKKAEDQYSTTSTTISGWEETMNTVNASTATALNAAKVNGLHDRLLQAHAAAVESVASHKAIVDELERLLRENKAILSEHQVIVEELHDKKEKTSARKTEVENALLAKMHQEQPWDGSDKPANGENGYQEPERPQIEALTPPPLQEDEEDDYNPPDAGENGSGTPPAMFGFEEAEDEDEHPAKKRKIGGYGAFEEDVDDLIRSEGGS